MRPLIACVRLLRVALHVARALWIVRTRFGKLTQAAKEQEIKAWVAGLLKIIAVKVLVKGAPAKAGPMLLVANHISWLDIPVLQAVCYCRFVSKADIRHWPVIGTLASACGALFIERENRRDAMRVVHHMAQSLRAGEVVGVFPEGTTSDGVSLLPFHANLLQAAVSAGAPVQAVSLRFVDEASGQISLAPAYVGDDSLLGSIWRTLTSPGIAAVVCFGEPQQAAGRDRRSWAQALRSEIESLRKF